MANTMTRIGDFDFLPDGPLGLTQGYNGAHTTDPQLFKDMLAANMMRVRLNVVPDYLLSFDDGKTLISPSASPSTWNWGFIDNAVLQANQAGIRVTLVARGLHPNQSAWTENTACDPAGTKFRTTIPNYAKMAVAYARRYSGDGNPDNAKDAKGNRLQADCIELGNEEINTYQDNTALPYTGCRSPMRYVSLVRTVMASLRASTASGGGGWVPRGTFLARVGAWGIVHDNSDEISSDYTIFVAPPLDATYNPTANASSLFGFDGVLNLQMLDYANFHNYNAPSGGSSSSLSAASETALIRGILDAHGNKLIPTWCTEAGTVGPCGGTSETAQANYYTANADGSGGGQLQDLKNAGVQHWDVFTMNYTAGATAADYVGQVMSIATKTSNSGTPPNSYVRFQAHTRIANFMNNVDKGDWAAQAVPRGFAGSLGGGGNPPPTGGTLSGAFAPLGSSTVNLTVEGTGDWAHWGVTGTTFDHKATGGTQISDATVVGNASKVQNPTARSGFTYTDGTPNATETATSTGIKVTPPVGGGGTSVPHVMVVALENHSYNNTGAKYVVGNPNFPHINSLMTTYGYCTKFYGISHPSLPNYLAFASGSDQGITSDTYNPANNPLAGNTLVDSLKTAGIAWKHYAENLPSTGYLGGDTGSYVQHHNPWVYFKTIRSNSSQYNNIVNYSDASVGLSHDLTAGTAPPFIYVQPNNTDNGHTGTDTQCDTFVNSLVSTVQASTWYAAGGIILLWWDESNPDTDTAGIGDKGSNGAGGGHTNCIVISAGNLGATLTSNLNHYGVLRGIEKLYNLPYLNNSNHTIDGDLTPLLSTTVGSVTTSNLGNGFKITAPADTNTRTLKIYTDVNQGIGTLSASLSDGSAPDFYDSTLTDSSGGSASSGVYTLTYNAAASGQTLNATYTLSDNQVPGILNSSDTFTRANQSNLGTSSDGQTYTLIQEVGTPAWSIASNQAKLTGAAGDTGVAILGTHTLLDCEAVGIINLSTTADSAGLVLRANTGGTTYYRASLTGSTIVLAYVTGGVSTVLSTQPATLKTNTNYWLRFRACKSSLYAKYWPNDGSAEPKNWSIFITDTTLGSAGKFGLRGVIGAASDNILFDTFSIVDLSATGDPSYVSLYAADLPTSVTTAGGSLSVSTSTPTGTIDLTAEGTGDWAHWGYSGATAFDHKSGVPQQISDFASIGSGTDTQDTAALLAYTWSDGTPDASVVASTTGSAVQGVANGFQFSVPADTTARTLNVYVQATKAQGQLTATLSDASASAYSDTSLNDSGTGAVKKYAITYNAASANQALTVQWTMLTDNGGGATTTTYSADTFTRANQSGWGTASGGETWVQTVVQGTPTESILSNEGKVTSTDSAIVVSLLGTQTQANAEALARFSISNLANDTASLLVRATATNTFYRIAVTGGNTLQFVRRTAGVDTTLSPTATISVVAGTFYWIRFRVNGSNLYGRFWADGASEPTSWTITTADTSGSAITGAGQWGIRTKSSNGDSILYNSYTVTSIPSGGTPGSISLQAVTAPGSATPPPPPPPPPPVVNTVVTVNANDIVTPNAWIGLGVQQDAYTQGTGAAITITADQRNLINTRLNFMSPPVIRTCADSVSWWCPTGVVGTYDFTNALMQEWYAVFDNAQANNISVIVGVNSPAPFTALSSSWCTAFADLVDYLINTLGYTCIRYVSGISEPELQ